MKKLLAFTILTLYLLSSLTAFAAPPRFSDVPDGQWFTAYVNDLSEKGIINGKDDGKFHPDDQVLYCEALKLILRAAGYPEQKPVSPDANWASGYLQLAINEGFLPAGNNYDLNRVITRQQVSQLASRALKLQTTLERTPFADTTDPEVMALYEAKILTGIIRDGKTYFDGGKSLQRSEISAIIWRMDQYQQEGSEKPEPPKPVEPKPVEPTPADPKPVDPKPEEPQLPELRPEEPRPLEPVDPDKPQEPGNPQQPEPPAEPSKTIIYKEHVLPVLEEVPVFSLDPNKFSLNNGRMTYSGDEIRLKHGIDVSKHQGPIVWEAVRQDGIDFAIIRIGYRGYTEGEVFLDPMYEQNILGAQQAGLEVGVYFYSQAITEQEGIEEAETVLQALRPFRIDGPVVFDWELTGKSHARTYGLDTETLCAAANAFCSRMEDAGYDPMIYFNSYCGYVKYDLSKVMDYDFWFAQYGEQPDFYYDFSTWQYTSKGAVNGVKGNVDLNVRFVPNK